MIRGYQNLDHIGMLREHIKLVLDMMFPYKDFILQQDHASSHVSRLTMAWMHSNEFRTFEWPARSPDLNIIEDVWTVLPNVYSEKINNSKEELWNAVQKASDILNTERQSELTELFNSIPKRLATAIKNKSAMTDH